MPLYKPKHSFKYYTRILRSLLINFEVAFAMFILEFIKLR